MKKATLLRENVSMKKVCLLIVCAILVLSVFTACGKKAEGTINEEAQFLVGDWDGEPWMSEVWTFNEDGTGHNENSIFPYDLEYVYDDGVLEVYEYLGSLKSDTPVNYAVTINSDNQIVLTDEDGYEYILTK
ncbi:MAG: DUF5640 domain-containing protein [Christensenella sp.]|uniref:DUF5640 domain-containing protein n=1 Tax=Christensenella sp. TaxID=1935934 RepID=UPI002B2155DC|nr:DUF5640 domain-containing protein [Christensenella sp.]MEA5004439.1 DUF5640 domain-containing protein [Christensenella sp.]